MKKVNLSKKLSYIICKVCKKHVSVPKLEKRVSAFEHVKCECGQAYVFEVVDLEPVIKATKWEPH